MRRHLLRLVEVLEPTWVVGIGAFADARARAVLGDAVRVARVLHPSPASPLAQRDWAGAVSASCIRRASAPVRRKKMASVAPLGPGARRRAEHEHAPIGLHGGEIERAVTSVIRS